MVSLRSVAPTLVLPLVTLAASMLPGRADVVSAADVVPAFVDDNLSCSQLAPAGTTWFELKVEPVRSGTYGNGPLFVDLTVRDTAEGQVIDWSSTRPLDAVFVKGGPNGNLYTFDSAALPVTEATADAGLHSPLNGDTRYYGLSHISFCYDYELALTQTVATAYQRTHTWNIAKSASRSSLTMLTGESGSTEYAVAATRTGHIDSDWTASGSINVENPNPMAATVTGVSAALTGDIRASVNCGVMFPYTLAAGQSLPCTYRVSLPDASPRTVSAVAETTGVVGSNQTAAGFSFGAPTTEINREVTVRDSFAGDLGTFNSGDVRKYGRTFTCDADRGVHGNVATINQTGQSASADVTVTCTAPVTAPIVTTPGGSTGSTPPAPSTTSCTLTPGYWKTHADPARKQYDPTWAMLANGAATPFFQSGQTYLKALQTDPKGNAYYILAHAYIAAELNQLDGVTLPTDVAAAFTQARSLLQGTTPAQAKALKDSARQPWIQAAANLDAFNNGLKGVPHCG